MEIKCINWFESKGNERFLFLKARNRQSETIFLRFNFYFYYAVTEDVYISLSPPAYSSDFLGNMNLIDISERVSNHVTDVEKKKTNVNVWLIKEPQKRNIPKAIMEEFLNVSWFFISNNISPEGCYSINVEKLKKINEQCYHCDCPKECFATPINRFNINRSYLFLDIECQFDKKFPSVFTNPVSHISCCYIDLTNLEFKFTLINEDILSNKDKKDATLKGYYKAKSVSDVDYTKEIIICSEITMLKVAKKLLELTFDYVVTFNGNNFDLRYISNRLELLTSGKIIFKSPDKKEHVHLCIYERNLSSHKGVGGVANTTYHVNNNNGTTFFDLYTYIQKSEKLDSYKLDSISKNAFSCSVKLKSENDNLLTFVGDNTTDDIGKISSFSEVLSTGNYITIVDDVFKIVDKSVGNDKFQLTILNKNNTLKKNIDNDIYTISFGKDDVSLSDMYKNYDLNTSIEMAKYCIHDACLCKYLWNYYGIETKIDAGAFTYILPQSMVFEYRASTLIKGPLLNLLLDEKIILSRSEKKNKYHYEGGKVFAPKQKMFINNVLIFDYNSLYPNVCLFGNLSPETLVSVFVANNRLEAEINKQEIEKKYPPPRYISIHCEPRCDDLISEIAVFDRNVEGIIPKLLKTFLTERARYKKKYKEATLSTDKSIYNSMQYTYKIIANSVYGLMGFKNSVLYSYSSAKSCTAIGRKMIDYLNSVLNGSKVENGKVLLATKPINPFFEDGRNVDINIDTKLPTEYTFNFKSVYGDTDSIFLEMDTNDISKSIRVAKELEKIINERILFSNFKIEFEAVYKNLIMQSKKKYTTLKYLPSFTNESIPERINKGTSETRRDVSKFHKYMIRIYKTRLLQMLSGGNMSSVQVCVEILSSLESDLQIEFETKTAPLDMFLLSRTHHCNYKSSDNPNMYLVNEYNKNNDEIIEIGERYYFAYICNKKEPWQKKLVNIKTYERIIDRSFKLKSTERIFYEVYFKRLATEIVNLLDNKVLSISFFEKMFGTRPIFYN
ncbi:DNA polymerase [Lumpy skin disease virus]|uniref:DNA polymerase n=1 Tax=Lumpy skin disease virus TaxID=59509 RepID=Q91MW8_LSDV|nr:DNA polymerase [Lumpy skin disease virus NI-2490]AAN02607.1 DNA polymerase [Lumpy skin disease virus NW-LW]AOE47615.1 DNA polymerase [Lumpy skin disease virus]AAK85000.1 LSDV039 DNA polymerase [Lumpy skin disease virus NI-2490]ARO77347.1 DNA polymerase [Lumpy skin disease virus]ART89365.1 DNA polymerase [Lumpy skin disease virus]